ncbi:HU family DNA-binding protein [Segatella maculosa]|uniref:Putative DNA-binding protein n=1 Tax=Segatella maculosa OT 289 TaxID=999422 RepID=H1HLY7_9BACT|nr:DNA-binding protein [Segatella maculosa]EHO71325.1 putative DNA-binding protein [Segatella maculosa OT 289]
MIIFKVVERVLGVGPKKGQKAYCAEPKAPNKFSSTWLVERIVRETSLSEGDVRNVLITLKNIIKEVVTLGGSLDLGDIFSIRTTIPSKMEAKEEDVCATSLKRPRILVRWKQPIAETLKKIEVEVDNPKRKEEKKKKKKEEGGIGQHGN